MASDEERTEGRKAALSILDRIQANTPEKRVPVSFEAITDALTVLSESQPDMSGPLEVVAKAIATLKHSPVDFAPLVEVLAGLDIVSHTQIDVSAVAKAIAEKRITVDLSTIEGELVKIRKALEANNGTMLQLVKAATATKKVKYDAAGRIVEIAAK